MANSAVASSRVRADSTSQFIFTSTPRYKLQPPHLHAMPWYFRAQAPTTCDSTGLCAQQQTLILGQAICKTHRARIIVGGRISDIHRPIQYHRRGSLGHHCLISPDVVQIPALHRVGVRLEPAEDVDQTGGDGSRGVATVDE